MQNLILKFEKLNLDEVFCKASLVNLVARFCFQLSQKLYETIYIFWTQPNMQM